MHRRTRITALSTDVAATANGLYVGAGDGTGTCDRRFSRHSLREYQRR